tara:strand:+ start:857 stop:1078 length:222 start_codon:yes stop_codon:yes gene_type:complete
MIKKIEFDNGLTAEQQAEVDAKYEEAMQIVKEKDIKLYQKMMSEVITYEKFMKIKELDDKDIKVNQYNQMNLF